MKLPCSDGTYPGTAHGFAGTGDEVVDDKDQLGGEYTLLDKTTTNLKQIQAEINGENVSVTAGWADDGSGYVHMKDFERKGGVSVLIRTTSREVPL